MTLRYSTCVLLPLYRVRSASRVVLSLTLLLSPFPRAQGKSLNALLPFTKSSPAMPAILNLIVRFQLAHPGATVADVEALLRAQEDELRELVERSKPVPKGKKRKGAAA